jgi:hypothetical protein
MAEKLKFYDLKKKKKFTTDEYKLVTKKGKKGRVMYAAVAKAPGGNECWLIVGKDRLAELKKK